MIWVLTPKTGRRGHVLPADIAEAAPTAGLMPTSSVNLGDWSASRLVQPKSRTGKRYARLSEPPPPTSPCETRTSSL